MLAIREIHDLEKKIVKIKSERRLLRHSLADNQEKLIGIKKRLSNAEKARIIIQDVANQTQSNLETHIASMVSLALSAVFPKPPKFLMKFTVKRNQTECNLWFEKRTGKPYKPLEGSGHGIVDVASFALRVAFWSLNKNRNTLILDEPFRNLSPGFHEKASEMLKMLSDKLGLQIIMVSHSETINKFADRIICFKLVNEVTKVEE